jgi:simple sugar transport system ATP-binding protein
VAGAQHLGVRTVYQELSLVGSMTVAENMFMGRWPRKRGALDHRHMAAATGQALKNLGLEIDPNVNVERLSAADQQMVEIARAIREEPKLLILDEPTSSLAAGEVERVLETVRRIADSGVAVIYVSHRLGEIRQIARNASVMRDSRLIDTREIAGVQTRDIVKMMVGDSTQDIPEAFDAKGVDGEIMVDVKGMVIEPKLHGVDLSLRRGEVLGIAGVLGSGRTEILQAIAGLITPSEGCITIIGRDATGKGLARAISSGIGLTPESRKELGIFPYLGVDENMVVSDWSAVSRRGFLSPLLIERAATGLIERLKIKTRTPRVEMQTLSGGNQQKAVIGRWLHADSKMLLLDEPTRGVDVEAKAQIYRLVRGLAAQGRGVIFVSSEIEELPLVCDRVLILRGGKIVNEYVAPDIDVDALLANAIAEH